MHKIKDNESSDEFLHVQSSYYLCSKDTTMLERFFFDHPIYYTVGSYEPNYLVGYIQECVIDGDAAEIQHEDGIYFVNTRNGRHICGTPEDFEAYLLWDRWFDNEVGDVEDDYMDIG